MRQKKRRRPSCGNRGNVELRGRSYLESRNFNLSRESSDSEGTNRSSLARKAVEQNQINALKFLLERGADVNVLYALKAAPKGRDSRGETLLHLAGRLGFRDIAMFLLSILWRRSVLLSGYPDFMQVNESGEDAVDVTADASLRELIRACIDRYSIVSVANLREDDSLADVRERILASCTLKESMKLAKFVVNDAIVFPQQEQCFPARLCCGERNNFIIYVPPTLHILEQVGVEVQNPEAKQREALDMLVYSFSHLSLKGEQSKSQQQGYGGSFSLVGRGEARKSPEPLGSAARMMSVAGESKNQIYKPISVGGNETEKRRMVENNMKECTIL